MVVPIAVGVGIVVGLVVGRWWALFVAVPFAVWIWIVSEVDEVPAWFLALGYGGAAALGIAIGVLVRRLARR